MADKKKPIKVYQFSERVNKTISEVLPSNDPFDQPTFNTIEYINQQFPDDASLEHLDEFILKIQAKIQVTEKELLSHVRQQALNGGTGNDLVLANETIKSLFTKVKDIKQKADQSEAIVAEIGRDIKVLDNAKRNLQTSIKTLNNIQLLEESIQKLKASVEQKDYKTCSESLDTANQLLEFFKDHQNEPQVKSFQESTDKIRATLHAACTEVFSGLSTSQSPPPLLKDMCLVVDSLGGSTRKEFMTVFIKNEVDKYKQAFPIGDDRSRLSAVEKRIDFLRRVLSNFDNFLREHFPPTWCVAQELSVEICLATHKEFEVLLKQERATIEVAVLHKAIQKTINFERELTGKFKHYDSHEGHVYRYHGFISGVFESVMDIFIEHEEKSMRSAIDTLIKDETWGCDDSELGSTSLLQSGSDLCFFLTDALNRTSALSKGHTLYAMYEKWSAQLVYYVSKLQGVVAKLPAQGPAQPAVDPMKQICVIINTCSYWREQTDSFAEQIRGKIDELYRSQVNMDAPKAAFQKTLAEGIQALLRLVDARLEVPFAQMLNCSWVITEIGDTNMYVAEVDTILQEKFHETAEKLEGVQFRYFWSKLADMFSKKLIANVYKIKRLNEQGIQQLKLDITTLRIILQQLPTLRTDCYTPNQSQQFISFVETTMKRCENVVRIMEIINQPFPNPEMSAAKYLELAPFPSVSDFTKLMELKGIQKSDIRPILEVLSKSDKCKEEADAKGEPGEPKEGAIKHVAKVNEVMKDVKSKFSISLTNKDKDKT